MMNIQDLATAMEYDIPVKIILTNNNALGLVRQQQDLFYGKRYVASDYGKCVDFVKIAEGFGIATCGPGQLRRSRRDPGKGPGRARSGPDPRSCQSGRARLSHGGSRSGQLPDDRR